MLLKDGSQFEGRLAEVTPNQLALALDSTSTTLWYRSEVRAIRVQKSGRVLKAGAKLAGKTTGALWASWTLDAAGPRTPVEGRAALGGIFLAVATPFIAGGAFVVGAVRGDAEWTPIYAAPTP